MIYRRTPLYVTSIFSFEVQSRRIADEDQEAAGEDAPDPVQDRIEKLRDQQAEGEDTEVCGGGMEGAMGGGGSGGMGGNPIAQMMGGVMGGGPGTMSGSRGGGPNSVTEPLERELDLLPDEVKDAVGERRRIADVIEDRLMVNSDCGNRDWLVTQWTVGELPHG